MSNNTIYERKNTMYQIVINNVRIPTIYWSLREAMEACEYEKACGCAVMCDIIPLDSTTN